MSQKQTAESFWAKVAIRGADDCWHWLGALNSTGYGNVAWGGQVYTAHRVAAFLCGMVKAMHAPMWSSDPTHVLHRCDNRKCCNPGHLFLGTYADNQKDAYTKCRRAQPRGQQHSNAKLTNRQAARIRELYLIGTTQNMLAKKYQVSQRVISLITRGESYKC